MKSNLLKRGFVSLILTQFFGAANDNVLKQVLIFMIMVNGLWGGHFGDGGQGLVGLGLTLPFILLSGYAGQVSDRFSKRTVTFGVKIAEIPIALIAGIGLWMGSFSLTFTAFILLAIQSTFFGPAKYGMIPELVEEGDLSRANGAINMFTNIAIIIGTLIAGPVSGLFHPKPDDVTGAVAEPVRWLPLAVMMTIAIVGLGASLLLPRLEAKAERLRCDLNPFGTYWTALRDMARGPLLAITLSWSIFYLIGMTAILIVPEYEHLLGISYTMASLLFAYLAVSIGVGSALAGLISGHRIEPRLVTAGAVGLTVFLALLGVIKPGYWNVALLISGAGLFAGAYLVPLQAMVQDLAPEDERGRYLGTANALSFVFSSLGGVLVILTRGPLNIPANRVFLVCAGISGLVTIVLFIYLRRTLLSAAAECNERRISEAPPPHPASR